MVHDRRKRGGVSLALYGLERRQRGDRRSSPRLALEIGCEGESDDGFWFYRLSSDVSLTGLSLSSGLPYPRGMQVRLKLMLPDGESLLELSARVVGLEGQAHGWGGELLDRTLRQTVEFFQDKLKP